MAQCHMCLTSNMDKLSPADRQIYLAALYETDLEWIECRPCQKAEDDYLYHSQLEEYLLDLEEPLSQD